MERSSDFAITSERYEVSYEKNIFIKYDSVRLLKL